MSFGYGGFGQLGHSGGVSQHTPKLIEVAAQGVCVVEVAAGHLSSVLLGWSGEVRHLGALEAEQ